MRSVSILVTTLHAVLGPLYILLAATPAIAQSEHPLFRGRILPCGGISSYDCQRAKAARLGIVQQTVERCISNNLASCHELLTIPDLSNHARAVANQVIQALNEGMTVDQWYRNKWSECSSLTSLSACDAALSLITINKKDRATLQEWRSQAIERQQAAATVERTRQNAQGDDFDAQWGRCFSGESSGCTDALSYPAITAQQHEMLTTQYQQIIGGLADSDGRAALARQAVASQTSAAASEVQKANYGQLLRDRVSNVTIYFKEHSAVILIFLVAFGVFWLIQVSEQPQKRQQPANAMTTLVPPPMPAQQQMRTFSAAETAAAQRALQLAYSYILEIDDISEALTDPAKAAEYLNIVTLASKQIAIAEQANPATRATIEIKDGDARTLELPFLKSMALHHEAMCRAAEDPKRSVKIMEQAIAYSPTDAHLHFWSGMFNKICHNRQKAIDAFERAVALDPDNLEYLKQVDRTRNISTAELGIAKTADAARTTINVMRWVPLVVLAGGILAAVYHFGISNVGFAFLCLVGLAIGAKIDEWARK